jgi:hypothetical protein
VSSHVFQHIGRRLNRSLTNLVHADRVPAVPTNHGSAAYGSSSPDVHASSLRFNCWRCGGIGTATMVFRCCPDIRDRQEGFRRNSYGYTVTIQVTLFEIEHHPSLESRIMWA